MDLREPPVGQSLSEYILAALLVGMVGIGALTMMGNVLGSGLPDLLDRIFGDASAPAASAPSATAASPGPPLTSGPSAAPSNSVPSLTMVSTTATATTGNSTYQSVSITLSSGQVLQLEEMPADLKSIVETSGTNGVTQIYATQIQTLAQQLKDSGAISADQASALEKLASQGHKIARAEKAIETAAASFADSASFDTGTVEFDGQTVLINDLADSVSHGDLVSEFTNLYGDAKSSGALDNDTVKLVVAAMYQDIKALADIFEDSVDNIANGGASPNELNQLNAAQITHADSATICEVGGGGDSGVKCN